MINRFPMMRRALLAAMLASSTLVLAQSDSHGHDATSSTPPTAGSASTGGNAGGGTMGGGMMGNGTNGGGMGSGAMSGGMMNGGTMSGGMMNGGMMGQGASGDVDRQFAERMKMHHEGAVQMAQAELERGKDPEMREMARKIIDSQRKEIGQFDQWLDKGRK